MKEPPTCIRRRLGDGPAISEDVLPGCDPRQEHTIRRSGLGFRAGDREAAVCLLWKTRQKDSCL